MSFAIETESLIKIFRSRWSGKEVRAVDGISLRVERGATFGLLGPNGAGKTTFVKMLLSCAHPTAPHGFMINGKWRSDPMERRVCTAALIRRAKAVLASNPVGGLDRQSA
jgi:ABC-type multidrug transport system ATPase subunit